MTGRFLLVGAFAAAAACDSGAGDEEAVLSASDAGQPVEAGQDAARSSNPDGGVDFLTSLPDETSYRAVAAEQAGTKYLARVDGRDPPAPLFDDCYFQNVARHPFHIDFLHLFDELEDLPFEEYSSWVLSRSERRLWGGEVTYFPDVEHPITLAPGVVVFAVYADESDADALVPEEIAEVHATLSACMPFAGDRLVFVPLGQRQSALLRNADVLLSLGVTPIPPGSLPQR